MSSYYFIQYFGTKKFRFICFCVSKHFVLTRENTILKKKYRNVWKLLIFFIINIFLYYYTPASPLTIPLVTFSILFNNCEDGYVPDGSLELLVSSKRLYLNTIEQSKLKRNNNNNSAKKNLFCIYTHSVFNFVTNEDKQKSE